MAGVVDMSDVSSRPTERATIPVQRSGQSSQVEPSGWVGFIAFGGVMLILAGFFHIIAGLIALFRDTYYVVPSSNLVVSVSYNTWGWVHLALGAVAVATGFGVMSGRMWARVLGIAVAVLSAIVNLGFLSAYPIWSTMVIAFDVVIIYALVAHGREMAEE
jgi:hypothetical protein